MKYRYRVDDDHGFVIRDAVKGLPEFFDPKTGEWRWSPWLADLMTGSVWTTDISEEEAMKIIKEQKGE